MVQGCILPTAERICRRALDGSSPEDIEDATMRTLVGVIPAMTANKRTGTPIPHLAAYVARAAQNASDEVLRRRYPKRTRVASQVRYLLNHGDGLALWQNGGDWIAGRADWRGREASQDAIPAQLATATFRTRSANHLSLVETVDALLGHAGSPLALGTLISAVQQARGETDLRRADDETENLGEIPRSDPDAHTQMEQREELAWLWQEVRELPVRQAQALLLNLRDARQKGVLDLLVMEGPATMDDLAEVLHMDPAHLAEIWDELPWEDTRIAEFLGARPIDISNLRSVAHRRIQRRMAKR